MSCEIVHVVGRRWLCCCWLRRLPVAVRKGRPVRLHAAATALLASNPSPTEDEVRIGLSGNLCRCTGYDGIVKAVLSVAQA